MKWTNQICFSIIILNYSKCLLFYGYTDSHGNFHQFHNKDVIIQLVSMYTKQVQYTCFCYGIFCYALKTIVVFSIMSEWKLLS